MPPERRQLLIDVETSMAIRLDVGLVAWVVLEAIASGATPGQPEGQAACSARSLAELVGVSKDTVARSIQRLIERRLLVRSEHRDERSGRFGPVTYRLDLRAAGITVLSAPGDQPPNALPTERPNHRTTDQLTLLQ